MENRLLFDFKVDESANMVFIKREFDADISLVWDAFTKPEILDQWSAPAPWKAVTKYMNFVVGGQRHYAMVSPEGQEFWSVQYYISISPKTNLKYISNFADKDGNANSQFKGSENSLNFSEENGITTVTTTIKYETNEVLKMMVERGFKEGTTATFDNLEKLFTILKLSK